MTTQDFYEAFRKTFEAGLQKKTGWGRNEIMQLFDRAAANAFAGLFDEMEDERQPYADPKECLEAAERLGY